MIQDDDKDLQRLAAQADSFDSMMLKFRATAQTLSFEITQEQIEAAFKERAK